MRGLAVILLFALLAPGPVVGGTPVKDHPGIGGHRAAPGGRDVCWSEPADLNGMIGSSEQILRLGIETEMANDFMIDGGVITRASWWGGYFENLDTPCEELPPSPGFNLRFYEDANCLPAALIADLPITDYAEELIDCRWGFVPIYKWSADVDIEIDAATRHWFGAQMMDHPFPPQAGRQAAIRITGCQSAFKSAAFGFPDWTPCEDVFGVAFDVSQEFECEPPTPVARSTWGALRALYR